MYLVYNKYVFELYTPFFQKPSVGLTPEHMENMPRHSEIKGLNCNTYATLSRRTHIPVLL